MLATQNWWIVPLVVIYKCTWFLKGLKMRVMLACFWVKKLFI